MLAAGIFNIIWIIVAFARIIDPKVLLRDTWVITPLPYLILDVGFGGNTFLSSVLVLIIIFGIIFSIIGGIITLGRRRWGLALVGSLATTICFPILGVIVIVLITRLKNQFVK
jgi:hypothetical protein